MIAEAELVGGPSDGCRIAVMVHPRTAHPDPVITVYVSEPLPEQSVPYDSRTPASITVQYICAYEPSPSGVWLYKYLPPPRE